MKKLELLAPAGSLTTLKAVICAGADAVYLGGNMFGARAYADNFTKEELIEGIRYAHLHGRKVFLTVNTLLKNRELEEELYSYLLPYYEEGLDAVIVQDMGVFAFVREAFADLPIHTSTQMTITNTDGARLLKEYGAERVVTAREMSLEEIRRIHDEVGIEIESFIHGALCYCYSGQCLLSSMLGGRSGNRGRCAQPCRLPYTVYDKNGDCLGNAQIPILSLKDLCALPFLYELADNGVYSFKIEGRMKSPEYAAGVVHIYRKYIDSYLDGTRIPVAASDMQALKELGNRNGFTDGYYYAHNESSMLTGETSNHSKCDGDVTESVRKEFVLGEIKEKINGKLKLFKDKPAMIQVSFKGHEVTCEGSIVLKANKQPLSKTGVEEKIRKTGNTPFVFDSLSIEMEDDVFLPINQLNQLRREALEQLQEAILLPYRRQNAKTPRGLCVESGSCIMQPKHLVSIENPEHLPVVLSYGYVDGIYLDSIMYEHKTFREKLLKDVNDVKAAGKKVYFVFPHIFRKRTSDFYEQQVDFLKGLPLDGYVVRSLDELGFLKEYEMMSKEIVGDSNLYTYSDRANEWYQGAGICRDSIPAELNQKEITSRKCAHSELVVYGRQPLMITAQCVNKNTKGCKKQMGLLTLEDRYHVHFPVRNYCQECYNVLYNSKPLCLFKEEEKISRIGLFAYRMNFTIEKEHEVKKIMDLYEKMMIRREAVADQNFLADYTNGHFKRGVE